MALTPPPPAEYTPLMAAPKEVMDIKDLAEYLSIGKSKIYALIRARQIPASRIGRQYRFSKEVVDSWLKERLITQPTDGQRSFFNPSDPSR
jgi:excisionase family DNA binding protein